VLLLKYNNREDNMLKILKLVASYFAGYGTGFLLFVLAMGVLGTLAGCVALASAF
jgi:hypothetical protein